MQEEPRDRSKKFFIVCLRFCFIPNYALMQRKKVIGYKKMLLFFIRPFRNLCIYYIYSMWCA